MPMRHRSVRRRWSRRWSQGQAGRVAVPAGIAVVLAVAVGSVVALNDGFGTNVSNAALAGCAAPSGAAAAAGASSPASPAPCPSGAAGTTAAAVTAAAVNPEAGRPDVAEANPVDPAGNPVSLNQTPAQAASTMNCTLTVPASPLSAQGLATPWQLGDGCSESNANEAAFVEATILAPNGQVSVYNPLVVTQGTAPAAAPAPPAVPAGSQVIIDTGFNGNTLVLEGAGAVQGRCIDAFGNSVIAQTAACNAPAFYADANAQIARGTLKVPPAGAGTDGKACETTRSFALIDQDQSDNVVSAYLLTGSGQTAQDTPANRNALAGAALLANGSDDGLIADFVDPALGCQPFTAPDPTSEAGTQGAQALNELSARQNQQGTTALLPVNDPQLLVDGQFSIGKTNTYRMLTDQPPLPLTTDKPRNAAAYCQDMVNIQPAKNQLDTAEFAKFTSPVPTVGTNLATFMGARLSASFTNLKCQDFGLKNPVTLTLDGNGVATAVTYNLTQQKATAAAAGTCPGNNRQRPGSGRSGGQCSSSRNSYDQKVPAGRRGHRENAAGM